MNFAAIADNYPLYLQGTWVTLKLLVMSLAAGLALALPLAVARASSNPWLSKPVWCFTYVVRGTPMLVQLFLIYYGLSQFEVVRQSALWPWLSSAWVCAWLAFAINTCAYTTEMIAGAITSTAPGEIEAAKSVGMSYAQMLRRVLLPSALRRAIPAYSNEVIMMLHGTSLASVVTIVDLTGAARETNAKYYLPFESFISAAVIYLAITLVLVWLFKQAEKRWLRHLAPRS